MAKKSAKTPRNARAAGKSGSGEFASQRGAAQPRFVPTEPVPEIPEVFLMTRVEQLRSISVPLRMGILRALAEKPMTTKQVALQLKEPVTKLYRHVEALSETGLIELVGEVPKRGTVQKFYRAAARCYKADDACFPGASHSDARLQAMFDILDAARRSIAGSAGRGSENLAAVAAASEIELTDPSQAQDLMNALTRALQQWCSSNAVRRKKQKGASYQVSLFVSPTEPGE